MAKSSNKKAKLVTMERRSRDDRRADRPVEAEATERLQPERRKTPRRRQIDPTTCERDYNVEEIQFMQAMDEYKHRSGNRFPTCCEILEIIDNLGYIRDHDVKDSESEFDTAMERYKQSSGRMFPTCSEVLEVLIGLGYQPTSTVMEAQHPGERVEHLTTEPAPGQPDGAAAYSVWDFDPLTIDD